MSQEDRLDQLERQVLELQQKFSDGAEVMQNIGGTDRMFQAVITGLIESHPDPEAMAVVVSDHLERQYTSIHFETLPEAHISGAQSAHTWLSACVQASLDRSRQKK